VGVERPGKVAAKRMTDRSAQTAAPTALEPKQRRDAEGCMALECRTPDPQNDQGSRPRPRFERDVKKGDSQLVEDAVHRAWGTQVEGWGCK
jgi:hypothetical protein